MFYHKKCFWWCSLGFIIFLITFVVNAEIACSAGYNSNPLSDIFKNLKTKNAEDNINEVNKSFNKFPDRHLSISEFTYILTHKKKTEIRELYVQSGKKIPYIDFMQEYDKNHVKILGIDQTLLINGHTFICHCGCVDRSQWNHWEPPARYSIKTKFNLGVVGKPKSSAKCICGCNEK